MLFFHLKSYSQCTFYLFQNDEDFVMQLHECYVKRLKSQLSIGNKSWWILLFHIRYKICKSCCETWMEMIGSYYTSIWWISFFFCHFHHILFIPLKILFEGHFLHFFLLCFKQFFFSFLFLLILDTFAFF